MQSDRLLAPSVKYEFIKSIACISVFEMLGVDFAINKLSVVEE